MYIDHMLYPHLDLRSSAGHFTLILLRLTHLKNRLNKILAVLSLVSRTITGVPFLAVY